MSPRPLENRVMWPVCLLLVAGWIAPEDAEPPEADLPVKGRPVDLPFSGASGRFRAETRAHPTRLRAGQPLTLTLVVQATGLVQHAPGPVDLSQVPALTDLFYIEPSL